MQISGASGLAADAGPQPALVGRLRAQGGRRSGPSHRKGQVPCQDAFAWWLDPERPRGAAAVADGLGSRPLSHLGSQAACAAALAALKDEPVWDAAALVRALAQARQAVEAAATAEGLQIDDLATTLQLAAVEDGRVVAAMVGDGAVLAGDPAELLLAPVKGGYANEVVPLTAPWWRDHVQAAETRTTGPVVIVSDGLLRLILRKDKASWQPYGPFFAGFLPAVQAPAADPGLVQRFLDDDAVDKGWDDDKCLVVIAHDPVG